MSLDVKKLEKVVDLADGVKRARCPACAEKGQDKKGEHLRIAADGKYGCCVFPGEREHRKRIYALAGERGPRGIKVRVAGVRVAETVQTGILGRLGRVFGSPAATYSTIGGSDASDGVSEVQKAECEGQNESRTPRTGVLKSGDGSAAVLELPLGESRTPRTPVENSRVYLEKVPVPEVNNASTQEEFREGVRSVREAGAAVEPPKAAEGGARLPFFTADGTLRIPFDSPERYHWWKPPHDQRLRVKEIIAELRARQEEVENGAAF
ncbi:MAG TPA: hypothetical protein PKN20_00105 [Verrucomicrobiota bacterium]|nr:hypothetical protein [Verrucomicrobiota bacterium]HOH39768.1 hypothetical protein [Verrucomicrobiota bacterium]